MMKRLFCLLALGVALSACENPQVDEIDPNTRTVTFCANFDETRTFLLNKTFYWDEDDAIGGFAENNNNVKFTTVQEEEGAKTGYFTGEISNGNPQFYLYYPYQKNASFAGTTLTMELPQTQKLIANSTHDIFPMVATTSDFDELVRFRNVAGVLRLTVKSNIARTITSLTFTATDENAVVWGTGTVDMADMSDEAEPTLTMNSVAGHNSVTLTGNVKIEAGKETYFYVVLPPATYTNGFTVTLSDGTNEVEAVYDTKDLPMVRNKLMAVSTPVEFNSNGTIVLNNIIISELNEPTIYFDQTTKQPTTETKFNGYTNISNVKVQLDYDAELDNGGNVTPKIEINGEEWTENGTYDFTKPVTIKLSSEELAYSVEYNVKISQLVDTGLPVVYVNTPSAITSKDDWTKGCQIYIDAEGRQSWDGTETFEDLVAMECEVKGRGNTTWGWAKKPYAIKLGSKAKVLGMLKHKRWVLLANLIDKSMIRNSVAFEIAKACYSDGNNGQQAWNPSGHCVELVLNGEHKGNYLLCEQIKIDENRVNAGDFVSIDTKEGQGYLIECDRQWGRDNSEQLWWNSYRKETRFGSNESTSGYGRMYRTNYYNSDTGTADAPLYCGGGMTFGLKGPDDGDLGENGEGKNTAAYKFIKDFVTEAEMCIFKEVGAEVATEENPEFGPWIGQAYFDAISEYIDVDSFVNYFLAFEVAMNHEPNNAGSVYMYYDKGKKKLVAGPIWDFDYGTFSYTYTDGGLYPDKSYKFIIGNSLWYVRLLQNTPFQQRVAERWTIVKPELDNLIAKLEESVTAEDQTTGKRIIQYLKQSAKYNWVDESDVNANITGLWETNQPAAEGEANGTNAWDPNEEADISFNTAAENVINNTKQRIAELNVMIPSKGYYW